MKTQQILAKRQAVVVMGMHRSGTSALAGVLNLMGCESPRTAMPSSDANAKGFFESSAIYELHKDLLASAGTNWMDWLPFHQGWLHSGRAEEFLERARAVIETEFGRSRLFVLKDPRICRIAPFWLRTLDEMGIAPLILMTHRNPVEVAASLSRHHPLTEDEALLLWLRHVLDAEHDTRGRPRHFTSYSRFLGNWGHEIARVEDGLGLTLPRQSTRVQMEIDRFLDAEMKHHAADPTAVLQNPNIASWIRDTFAIMERWAAAGEDAKDFATLDRIAQEFTQSGPVFAKIAYGAQDARVRVRKVEQASKALELEVVSLRSELDREVQQSRQTALDLDTLKAERTDLVNALSQAKGGLEQRNAEREHDARLLADALKERDALRVNHAAALDKLQKAVAAHEVTVAARQKQIETYEKSLGDRFQELSALTRIAREAEDQMLAQADQIQVLNAAIVELRTSTFWRLTGPLRSLTKLVRAGR